LLAFITGRGNATRTEIETFYRQNIGKSLAAEVDARFNRVAFMVDINSATSYTCVLARDAKTGQYILSYESYFGTNVKSNKTLTAPTLEALLAEMRKNTADFSQTSIDNRIMGDLRTNSAIIAAADIPKDDPRYGTFTLSRAAGDAIFVNKTSPVPSHLLDQTKR
jgi:hypothetical protein